MALPLAQVVANILSRIRSKTAAGSITLAEVGNTLQEIAELADSRVATDDKRLNDNRTPTAHAHPVTDINGLAQSVRDIVAAMFAAGVQKGIAFDYDAVLGAMSVMTPVVRVPSQVTGVAGVAGDTQVTLNWLGPAAIGAAVTAYRIKFRVVGAATYAVFGSTANQTIVVTGLLNATSYEFTVEALNSVGFGPASVAITAKPAGDVRVVWGGISAGGTVDASTGAIFLPAQAGLYSALTLLPAPGSHITWRLPADLTTCKNLTVGLDNTPTLGRIDLGAYFLTGADGNLYANGTNVGPATPSMFQRIEIASNAKDFLLQTSPDGQAYTTLRTVADVASYYTVDTGRPMYIRVLANSDQPVASGPLTANSLVNGLVSVAFDGNSLTAGTNSTTGVQGGSTSDFSTSMSFPSQLIRSLTRNAYMAGNFGVSGQTTVQMSSDAATQIDIKFDAVHYRNNILVAWEITNDYCNAGVTKEVAYSDFVTYCTNRRAAGWRVVVLNVINRTTNLNTRTAADFAAAQTYWNGRLATEFTTFADALVDVNALNLQTTANWDGTHPSDPGYALVAAAIKTAIAPLLA